MSVTPMPTPKRQKPNLLEDLFPGTNNKTKNMANIDHGNEMRLT